MGITVEDLSNLSKSLVSQLDSYEQTLPQDSPISFKNMHEDKSQVYKLLQQISEAIIFITENGYLSWDLLTNLERTANFTLQHPELNLYREEQAKVFSSEKKNRTVECQQMLEYHMKLLKRSADGSFIPDAFSLIVKLPVDYTLQQYLQACSISILCGHMIEGLYISKLALSIMLTKVYSREHRREDKSDLVLHQLQCARSTYASPRFNNAVELHLSDEMRFSIRSKQRGELPGNRLARSATTLPKPTFEYTLKQQSKSAPISPLQSPDSQQNNSLLGSSTHNITSLTSQLAAFELTDNPKTFVPSLKLQFEHHSLGTAAKPTTAPNTQKKKAKKKSKN